MRVSGNLFAHARSRIRSKGSLSKVALVIKEASLADTPFERFVFDFDWIIPEENIGTKDGDWVYVPLRNVRRA